MGCSDSLTASKQSNKLIHTGIEPFICNLCEKGFTSSGNLTRHKRSHIGVRPFICDLCKKEFRNSSNLTWHKLIHTGVKPFQCDLCVKGLTSSGKLNTYEQSHTGVKLQCVPKKRDPQNFAKLFFALEALFLIILSWNLY